MNNIFGEHGLVTVKLLDKCNESSYLTTVMTNTPN